MTLHLRPRKQPSDLSRLAIAFMETLGSGDAQKYTKIVEALGKPQDTTQKPVKYFIF